MSGADAGAILAVGEPDLLAGYRLVGVRVLPATCPADAVAAWRALGPDTALVLLTPSAAAALEDELSEGQGPLRVVLPS